MADNGEKTLGERIKSKTKERERNCERSKLRVKERDQGNKGDLCLFIGQEAQSKQKLSLAMNVIVKRQIDCAGETGGRPIGGKHT